MVNPRLALFHRPLSVYSARIVPTVPTAYTVAPPQPRDLLALGTPPRLVAAAFVSFHFRHHFHLLT
jgi:hypothetical protein